MSDLLTKICLTICLLLFQACSGSGSGNSAGGSGGDSLSIIATPDSIVNNGDISEVSITLTHGDGSAFPDGTVVYLFPEEGNIASQVSLRNGKAETNYSSGADVGLFKIWAQTTTIGLENNIYTTIEVQDAAEQIGDIVIEVSPSTVSRQGGTVNISATVFDPEGNPAARKKLVFSTDRGTLKSNGALLTSSTAGKVTDVLTLDRIPLSVDEITITADASGIVRTETIGLIENKPPDANIVYYPNNPRFGQLVTFDATESTDPDGDIEEWLWLFPDGSTANTEEASYAFTQSDAQVVSLTVTDDLGTTNRAAVTVIVGTNSDPIAFFTFSPTSPRMGQVVNFDGSASEDPDGTIAEYLWAMGDGSNRTGGLVNYAYSTPGTYNAVLTVKDNYGGSNSSSQLITVQGNQPPIAVISVSKEVPKIGERVLFYATDSYDPDGSISKYEWNFGNNTGSTSAQANVTFTTAGVYVVQLKITDNEGGQGFDTKVITVEENGRPEARFVFNPNNPRVGEALFFDASTSSDTDGFIETWAWDFGDNTYDSGEKVIHAYDTAGAYLVHLVVTDNQGSTDNYDGFVQVSQNSVPSASFTYFPNNPSVGTNVSFDATESSDSDGQITGYRWQFGDGGTANGQNVTHTFQSASNYTVRLTVTDDGGTDGTTSSQVIVGSGGEPTASLNVSPNTVPLTGGVVTLDASGSSDPEDNSSDLRYSFSANASTGVSINHPSTNFPNATASIGSSANNATITFRVVVTDTDGNTDQSFAFVTATATPLGEPIATFKISTESLGVDGGTVVLDGGFTQDGNTHIDHLNFNYAAHVAGNAQVSFDPGNHFRRVVRINSDPNNPIKRGDQIVFALLVSDPEGNLSKATKTLTFR